MAGRKKKISKAIIKIVSANVRMGMSYAKASEAAGICVGSHKRYMAQGRLDEREGKTKTLECRYRHCIMRAKADLAADLMLRIKSMAMNDESPHTFRALRFLAERCLAEDYAPRTTLNLVEGEVVDEAASEEIEELKAMSDDQLKAYAAVGEMTDEQLKAFLDFANKGD